MKRSKRFLSFCMMPVTGLLSIDLLSGGSLSDPLFFIGLLMLLVGGTLQVIHAGVFDSFFRSFKTFRRHSGKLEDYVLSKTDGKQETVLQPLLVFAYLSWAGVLLICGTGLIGAYIY